MAKNYVRIGNCYHYIRRVPKKVAEYDKRAHVRISLDTKDEREARRGAAIYNDFIEKYWKKLIQSGQNDEEMMHFKRACREAKAHGFAYKNIAEIAESPLDEILARAESVDHNIRSNGKILLGGVTPTHITLEKCPEIFWPLCADRFTEKSEHQIIKFKNPREAAMKNFIQIVGNKQLTDIDRSHVLQFRKWLMDRIATKKIAGDTANKQMRHVKNMLHTVAVSEGIEIDFELLFAKTKFQKEINSRLPYDAAYVQETFLDNRALQGLKHPARMLAYMMMDTGARGLEIIGLDQNIDIILDEKIPHIWIQKNKLRSLKTPESDRKIPLVGVALEAAKEIVDSGFECYQANPDSASGDINKYFKANGLKPTPRHSLYSFRHTFKDRLRDVGAPEEVIHELMGHIKPGIPYGRGHTLETKYKWLKKIAFTAPRVL